MRRRIGFLLILPLTLTLFSFSSQGFAGRWSDFCGRYLISDYPFPYEDAEFKSLVREYKRTHNIKMLDEILFRYRTDVLSPEDRQYFREIFMVVRR